MKINSMLRPPLSSTIFFRPNTSRRVHTNVVSTENESTRLQNIEITIERTRGRCSLAYGRQEKAYIKVLNDLEKERSEIIKCTQEKSCDNTNDSCSE
jgi:hypothetical protein